MQETLFQYLLRLGDDSLILGQRLSEWCGHGPILEEDIALTNISLDLIGQATSILKYASEIENKGRDEDKLAFMRFENEYLNTLLVEQPNGHFGDTILRQFFFDAFRKPLYERLTQSKDKQLSAIAEKSLKETRYHLKHSSEWVIRLGDGTEESHDKIQKSVENLMRYTSELFYEDKVDLDLQQKGLVCSLKDVKQEWDKTVRAVFHEATLKFPDNNWSFDGGRQGRHSEHMGYILADMQYMQRAYPNMKW
ncbi:MAG: phenylacetate-CoA oxygenase subunit PaaC [Bacteroidetes bacterium]|nr:phenylacetate-CoA oxygenase subunit PaaC [Bacteroidota bacterium]